MENIVKPAVISAIAGLCAIICVYIAVSGFVDYKRTGTGGVTVTGSATQDFEADLVVWGGSFSASADTTKTAYELIKNQTDIIEKYLRDNGIQSNEYVFSAVRINEQMKWEYDGNNNLINSYVTGYELTGRLTVESEDVSKIEKISRDITTLIDSGVNFFSDSPEYYYTKLDELKLEMIEAATKNAEARIDRIMSNTGQKKGKLLNANLGVFQITAQNSALDEFSASGSYNTWSRYKTASITVKLYYAVK